MKRTARPHKATTAARARHRIKAHMDWLRGYPLGRTQEGLAWCTLPELEHEGPPQTRVLSGGDLSRATRARRELLRDHADVLGSVVHDAKHWSTASHGLLTLLGPAVHGKGELPSSTAVVEQVCSARLARQHRRVRAQHPALGRLLDAMAFALALDPKALSRALRCLDAHGDGWCRLASVAPDELDLMLALVELTVADGAALTLPLLELIAWPDLNDVPLAPGEDLARVVSRVIEGKTADWPERLRPSHREELIAFVRWLRGQALKPRRAALSLVAELDVLAAMRPWSRYHRRRDKLLARAQQAQLVMPFESRRSALEIVRDELVALQKKQPTVVLLAALLVMLRLASSLERRLFAAIVEALDALEVTHRGRPLRMAMFGLWMTHIDCEAEPELLRELLGALTRLARARPSDELAALYERYLDTRQVPSWQRYHAPDLQLLILPAGAIAAFFDAIHRALAHEGVVPWRSRNRVLTLTHVAEVTGDGERAYHLYRALVDAGVTSEDGNVARLLVTTTMSLCKDDDGAFGELAKALDTASVVHQAVDVDDGLGLAKAATDPRLAGAFRRALLRGEARLLSNLGARLHALRFLGAPGSAMALPRFVARDTSWTQRYPAALQPLLAALASVAPDAEAIASRLLARSFPRSEDVAAQITSLRSKIAHPGLEPEMRRRLEGKLKNLQGRLRGADPIKPRQLTKLVARLEAQLERHALSGWTAQLERSLAEALLPRLGLDHQPPWLLESPCIDLLPHLLSVPELPSRRLALRLLRARAGPFPWDLRDEPANAHFIAALSRRGIRMTPWIDGIGLAAEDTPRGRVFVQLERDPLEVLMMGKHFDTCLSPGWFNFFSAVSNAADVNKRVLYVRDEHGTVAGRCLLALDKEGRILTFHAYCHDSEGYAMLDVTRRFVLRLAQAMGTSIVTQGEVSCLLSHDWYDDGPEDIAGSFAPFAAGSDLRNWLTGAAPEELASGLRRHLDPLGVNALTLPLLLSLREVAERPELALPLLDEVERIDNISSDTMGRATMLCWRAHEHERARRFAFERLLPTLEQRCHPDRPPLPATLELLVELGAPSRVLRLIQRSRGRNVRQWSDEPDARRIFAAARAHQSLHRHKLAATLYRLALGRRSAHDLHPRCRQALTELGAHP